MLKFDKGKTERAELNWAPLLGQWEIVAEDLKFIGEGQAATTGWSVVFRGIAC